jgi:hypothetical protein
VQQTQLLGHPSMPTITGADLCTYLLHSAATVIEEVLRTVLEQLGVHVVGPALERNYYMQSLHIFGSRISGDWRFLYEGAGVPAPGVALMVPAETHQNTSDPLVLSFRHAPDGTIERRITGLDPAIAPVPPF